MSGQSCGVGCARIILIIFNVVFWLSGAALLAIGIWMLIDKDITNYLDLIVALESDAELLKYASYVLIGIGGFVFIVGFLGCCGALKQNRCLLGLYIFFMVIIMAAEIGAGVLGILFKDKIEDELQSRFVEELAKTSNDDWTADTKTAFVSATIKVQETVKCCGWTDSSDYTDNSLDVPDSCTGFESTGCEQGIKDFISDNSVIIIGVGIGIGCLELFGFIFAVCLCRNVEE